MSLGSASLNLRSFQDAHVSPVVATSSEDTLLFDVSGSPGHPAEAIYCNGKRVLLGLSFMPPPESVGKDFYDDILKCCGNIVLKYQLIHRKNGVLISKYVPLRSFDTSEQDGASSNVRIYRTGRALVIATEAVIRVSNIHLGKSLTLSITVEFDSSRTSTHNRFAKSGRSTVDEEERAIRNAIENPKYKPQRVVPRKASTQITLIDPLKVTVESSEEGSGSTVVNVMIQNTHPSNSQRLLGVHLNMNSTVRDFERDHFQGPHPTDVSTDHSTPVAGQRSLSKLETTLIEGVLEAASNASVDEYNAEEYVKIVRADRYFKTTAIHPTDPTATEVAVAAQGDSGTEAASSRVAQREKTSGSVQPSSDEKGVLIRPGESWSIQYQLQIKDQSHVIVGNFLAPLDIRHLDVHSSGNSNNYSSGNPIAAGSRSTGVELRSTAGAEAAVVYEAVRDERDELVWVERTKTANEESPAENGKPVTTSNVSIASSVSTSNITAKKSDEGILLYTFQVPWSSGTKYLNASAFERRDRVNALEASSMRTSGGGGAMGYNQLGSGDVGLHGENEYHIDDDDGDIAVIVDGPNVAVVNVIFQVVVVITNKTSKSKRFILGIVDSDDALNSPSNRVSNNQRPSDGKHTANAESRDSDKGISTGGFLEPLPDAALKQFIPIEVATQLSELRPGETTEAVIHILPLQAGELILDSFYLIEESNTAINSKSNSFQGCATGCATSESAFPFPLPGNTKCVRRFAHSFPIMVVNPEGIAAS